MRIGFGSDIHKLEKGVPLIIGGVDIDSDLGSVGHSDGDALLHAVTDSVLGALALGDIGTHFPPSDDAWKDADSSVFLSTAVDKMRENGYEVANLDAIVNLERPRLRPFIEKIRENLAGLLQTEGGNVSLKAKTGDGLDAVGECRAIKAEACILLKKASS